MLEVVLELGWIDGLQMGTFLLLDVVARTDQIRSAFLSYQYWWSDHSIKYKSFSVYHKDEGVLATPRRHWAASRMKCSVTRFGARRTARNLWDRAVHFRCAVGSVSAPLYPLRNPFFNFLPRSLDPHMAASSHVPAVAPLKFSSLSDVPPGEPPQRPSTLAILNS